MQLVTVVVIDVVVVFALVSVLVVRMVKVFCGQLPVIWVTVVTVGIAEIDMLTPVYTVLSGCVVIVAVTVLVGHSRTVLVSISVLVLTSSFSEISLSVEITVLAMLSVSV